MSDTFLLRPDRRLPVWVTNAFRTGGSYHGTVDPDLFYSGLGSRLRPADSHLIVR